MGATAFVSEISIPPSLPPKQETFEIVDANVKEQGAVSVLNVSSDGCKVGSQGTSYFAHRFNEWKQSRTAKRSRVSENWIGIATKFEAKAIRYDTPLTGHAANELKRDFGRLEDTVKFFVQGIPNALKVGKTLQKFHTLLWLVGIV